MQNERYDLFLPISDARTPPLNTIISLQFYDPPGSFAPSVFTPQIACCEVQSKSTFDNFSLISLLSTALSLATVLHNNFFLSHPPLHCPHLNPSPSRPITKLREIPCNNLRKINIRPPNTIRTTHILNSTNLPSRLHSKARRHNGVHNPTTFLTLT